MFLRALSLLIVFFISSAANAWNTTGQLIVSELALQQLSPAKQRYFEQLTFRALKQMEAQKRLYLMRTFDNPSSFAQLSVFPDELRNMTLNRLYEQYADKVPVSLAPFAEDTTAHWHYINQHFQLTANTSHCENDPTENIVSILPVLLDAFREASSDDSKALTLAFITHLVADVHNPLNTISKVDEDCESDRHRNRICVAYRSGSRSCEQTLQQAWESGVGLFEDFENVAEAVEQLARVNVDEDMATQLDADIWAKEGFDLARLVYAVKPGERLDPFYLEEGKIIAVQRVTLAAARLAAILDQLYP